MSPNAQRIALAEACGWKLENYGPPGRESLYWRLIQPNGTVRESCMTGEDWTRAVCSRLVPNYLNDLNAMHEAEKTLMEDQWNEYSRNLDRIVLRDKLVKDPLHHINVSRFIDVLLIHATAAQRAETFLRTIGKWLEDAVKPGYVWCHCCGFLATATPEQRATGRRQRDLVPCVRCRVNRQPALPRGRDTREYRSDLPDTPIQAMTFNETCRHQMAEILKAAPPRMTPEQSRAYLIRNCPYTDKIKIRAWKALATEYTTPERTRKPISRMGLTDEERSWVERQR
jgi:hypothetical protein